jgi:DNA-binding PadR family transcriptional regulator
MSGYDVRNFIARTISNFWRESYGQIYPTLRVLESEGLVDKQTREGKGRPDRNVYSLTPQGRETLREWLVLPAEPEIPRHELLLKLFFGAQVAPEDNLLHIARYRAEAAEALEMLRGTSERLIATQAGKKDLAFWLLGIRLGALVNEGVLAWCDEADAVLRGESRPEDLFAD